MAAEIWLTFPDGSEHELKDSVSIGRDARNDLVMESAAVSREHAGLTGRKSVPLTAKSLSGADAVLIVTDHDDVDYSMVAKHGRLVLDTRNAMTRAGLAGSHIRKA